ncbi:MAG: thioredoxin family protein [Nitrospiraceae bacterium]
MIHLLHDDTFETQVERTEGPVLVLFGQEACGHCRALEAQLERVAHTMGRRLTIGKIDVQQDRQIASELEVTTLPALALYDRGRFVQWIGGLGTAEAICAQVTQALHRSQETIAGDAPDMKAPAE